MEKILGIIEPDVKFSIEESQGEVDGKHILARIKGTFFVPGGISRNNRFYPTELWEKVCSDGDICKRLEERRMLGTIGHEQKLNDSSLLEGKISHIVTNLKVQGNQGIGEALILDTPAGKILNTLIRAGSKLFVSSRADGEYKGDEKGIPRVNPDTFKLETFDFVVDPGFLQANPKLAESFENLAKIDTNNNFKGDIEMEPKLLENIAKENAALKYDLERAATEVETLKNENVVIQEKLKNVEFHFDKNKGFKSLSENQKLTIKKYEELGTPEDIKTILERVKKFSEEVGTFGDVKKCLSLLEKFQELGSVKEVTEALTRSVTVVEEYKQLGSIEEIKKLAQITKKMISEKKLIEGATKIAALSKELAVSEEKIKKLWGKMTEEEIREFFKEVSESAKIAAKYSKTGPTPILENTAIVDAKKVPLSQREPRASRLMESLSGRKIENK